jgi:hypothetical protein
MELFIRIKDGQPFEHPFLGDNFRQAFPDVDTDNLPPEFARFERVECPTLGMYETLAAEEPTYELIDGVYKDVWHIREMTAEEKEVVKQQRIQNAKYFWSMRFQAENWSAWILNEETFEYEPPIPRPEKDQAEIASGILTFWCGAENGWKKTPVHPGDIMKFRFDFFAWEWIPLVLDQTTEG